MAISEWLDEKEAKNLDVSQIALPEDLSYDEFPDETIYFKEINPCGFFCTGNHPFSTDKYTTSHKVITERLLLRHEKSGYLRK